MTVSILLLDYLDSALPGWWKIKVQNFLSITGLISPIPSEVIELKNKIELSRKNPSNHEYHAYFLENFAILRRYLYADADNVGFVDNESNNEWTGLTPQAQFTHWEYFNNSGNNPKLRGDSSQSLTYFLIPENQIAYMYSGTINSRINAILRVEQNGQVYYKFPVNNEDTRYKEEIKKYLQQNNLDDTLHTDTLYSSFKTASRSCWITDDILNPNAFGISIKASTNHTGGKWQSKPVTRYKALQSLQVSALIQRVTQSKKFNYLIFLTEPLALVLGSDQNNLAVVLRDYAPVFSSGNYLMPAFSTLHETQGKVISQLNGSNNPSQYWEEHLVKPLALAQAELAAYTSLTVESAHSQQYLVELNRLGAPTGRIALRDYDGSFSLTKFYPKVTDFNKRFFNARQKSGKMRKALEIRFGLFHGTSIPSWLSVADINRWLKTYFETFENHFMSLTGLTREDLGISKIPRSVSFFGIKSLVPEYFSRIYPTNTPGWESWYEKSGFNEVIINDYQQHPCIK